MLQISMHTQIHVSYKFIHRFVFTHTHTHTHTYIYIYIYTYQVVLLAQISLTLSPLLSLSIRPYHPSLPAGLLNYIL